MDRLISGFHLDSADEWVAELVCGHNQHVRHDPPFRIRTWVLDTRGRASRIGTPLACVLCDRCELPETLRSVRTSATWDEKTMPAGLRRAHRLAAGTWGRITVHSGQLRFRTSSTPTVEVTLDEQLTQAIPPEMDHDVEPLGAVTFSIEFFVVDRTLNPVARDIEDESDDEGAIRPAGRGCSAPTAVP